MLRRHRQLRTRVRLVSDSCLFAVGLWVAHYIRSHWHLEIFWRGAEEIEPFSAFVWLILIIIPCVPLALVSQGFYQRPFLSARRTTAWRLFKASLLATVALILVLYLSKLQLARSVVILFGPVSFLLVFLKEEILMALYKSNLGQSQLQKYFILVGSGEDTQRLRGELQRHPQEGIKILAELDLNKQRLSDLVNLLHDHSANGVIFNAKHTYFGEIEKAIQACELEGVEAWLVADFFNTHISQTSVDEFYGRPILIFRSAPEVSWQGALKQVIDIAGALASLLVLSPFFVLFALLIKLTSPGPVLFRQQRCGLNGQPFTMLKFRSMVTDAEQRQAELAAFNEMGGPVFKLTNDPRVTRVGRFLRKYSIDEWPQFINVLSGHMSLVGPRPLPVDEVRRFDDLAHRRRLSVKPGLTCLWQISGRNNVKDFKDWVRLDLEYIDNWSLWLDVKILWRTIPVVLAGTGAK